MGQEEPPCGGRALPELQDLPEPVFHSGHLFSRGGADSAAKPLSRDRPNLIGHGHGRSSVTGDRDQDRRTELGRTGSREHDDRLWPLVEHLNRDQGTEAFLENLRTEGWIQSHPPDFAALGNHFHGSAVWPPRESNSLSNSATSYS